MKTILLAINENDSDDITVKGDGLTALEAIVALMRAGDYMASALARTVALELGFKVVADRQGGGKFFDPAAELEQEFEQVLATPAPIRGN